ncbi:Alkanal monooxygenase alpha chain [bacterium HR19]|nr:Alkanal monooxygenase alpha chain [bacterium HR19]
MKDKNNRKLRCGLLHLFESAKGKTEKQFYEENIELIKYADEIGLQTAWIAEHHFSEYGVMPSTQVFASYIAGITKRIRIGTGVVVLPFHHPIRVAEEFAFIDVLSDGRLDFGVGRGYQPHEFEGYGIPISESRNRFEESLQIIKMAWTEEEVNFEGKHFIIKGARPRPRPLQKPHPPLFGASFNAETIKFQAKKKMNLIFSPLLATPDKIDEYIKTLQDEGENPENYRIGGLAFVYVADDMKKAFRDFEEPCMWYFRTFSKLIPAQKYPEGEDFYKNLHFLMMQMIEQYDRGKITFEFMATEGLFQHGFLVGTPSYVAEKLKKLIQDYKLTDLLCWTRLGGLEHEKVMKSMKLFVEKVLPDVI